MSFFIVYLFIYLVFLLSVCRDTSTTVLFNKIWIRIKFMYVCVYVKIILTSWPLTFKEELCRFNPKNASNIPKFSQKMSKISQTKVVKMCLIRLWDLVSTQMAPRYMHSGTLHYGYLAKMFCPGETYTTTYSSLNI